MARPQPVIAAPLGAATDDFVITVQTDETGVSSNTQFMISTTGGGYNYNVDCDNDGINEVTGVSGDYFCSYGAAGTYTIRIKDNGGLGTGFPRIFFNNTNDAEKLISIDQWGTGHWTSMNGAFNGCFNMDILAIDAPDLGAVTDMSYMFANTMFNDDISAWDVSNVTTMIGTFSAAMGFNQPLNSWDVANVTSMNNMFYHAWAFNQDLNSWNVANVTDMTEMFRSTIVFNGNITSWNTANVTNMSGMFQYSDFNQPIGAWNTGNVTDMSWMFRENYAFDQAIDGWDTTNVTDMSGMFYKANFNHPIGSWNTGNVTSMYNMFSLATFNQPIGNWNTSSVTSMESMFEKNAVFNQDISGWDTGSVTTMHYMFDNASKFNQNLGGWDVEEVTSFSHLLRNTALSTQNYDKLLIGWDAQSLQPGISFFALPATYCLGETARANMISSDGWSFTDGGKDCSAYDDFIITVKTDNSGTSTSTQFTIPTSGAGYNYNVDCEYDGINEATAVAGDYTCNYTSAGTYTVRITDNSGTDIGFPRIYFNNTGDDQKLISIDQWGTMHWTSMEGAFSGCQNMVLNATDMPDLSGVTSTVRMFYFAQNFNQDISGWDVSNVTNMQYMFGAATTFNQNIGGWNTSNVEKMDYMFNAAYAFNQNLNSWDTTKVWNMAGMFGWGTSFNGNITSWDTSNVTVANDMFYNAINFNQDIGGWDTGNIRVTSGMFRNAQAFNQDISGWDMGDNENMNRMFMDANSFDQDLGLWDVSSLTSAEEMFLNVKLSTANYDSLLLGWDLQTVQSGVTLDGGLSNYCNAEAARTNLVSVDGWTITDAGKNCAPPTTTLISPGDGAIVPNANITFIWAKVDGADKYTLEVRQVSDNVTIHSARYNASARCGLSTCSVTLPGPFDYRAYKWHVAGWGGSDRGDFTTWNVFNTTLTAVQLRSPGVDAIVYGGRPTFKWYPHPDALSYIIEFYDSTAGPPDVLIMSWQKNPTCSPYCEFRIPGTMDLGSDYGDYRWRVRAKNSGLEGEWSEMRTFTYTQLERTVQVSPADGFSTTDTTPTFQWTEITGATMYLFQVRLPDDTFVGNFLVSDATYCIDGGNCTWDMIPGVLVPGTTYKWHVRAKNGRNFGRWTAYRTIEITP